ncbi:MAG: cytochrome d ubiquinol oxidase subunit II [Muribaculaceae bacterium]|nr:cytochrome d ubiquinol oxidase subunit II [Muribaculaceae bacterium]
MDNIANLQAYWWLLIAVLGAALVFLLFVQGGQTMLYGKNSVGDRQMMVNALGRKWELTFTTLVVFGGAFFASFPLFYSTSFGGAYWLWMLILLSFVVQAFSYEFRRKKGNLYGTRFYDILLFANGLFGCVLLGVAVGTFFFGGDFTVTRSNLLDAASPVISRWGPLHGLEAMACWKNVILGVAIFFLARTLGALYFTNTISAGSAFTRRMRAITGGNGLVFVVFFVTFLIVLLLQGGYREVDGHMVAENNIYLHNLLNMWWFTVTLLVGTLMVLYGVFRSALSHNWYGGIWWAGIGVFLVVLTLFCIAGYDGTAYLPSTADAASSLTIANSSSSLFTLRTMTYVSFLLPVVLAYIIYVWAKMNASPITEEEIKSEHHLY